MRKNILFAASVLMSIQLCLASDQPLSATKPPKIENFADFPGEPSERFYYVHEYPYTTLFVVAAAVGGILYYHRSHFRKQIQKILRILRVQESEDAVVKT